MKFSKVVAHSCAYEWKPGCRISADAQRCGDEIFERIVLQGKPPSPFEVYQVGKDPSTELHKGFTWDDGAAAEKQRLREASILLQHLVLVKVKKKTINPPTRAYVCFERRNDESDESTSRCYGHIVDVASDDEQSQAVLNAALHQLRVFKAKYNGLKEILPVIRAIDKVLERPVDSR